MDPLCQCGATWISDWDDDENQEIVICILRNVCGAIWHKMFLPSIYFFFLLGGKDLFSIGLVTLPNRTYSFNTLPDGFFFFRKMLRISYCIIYYRWNWIDNLRWMVILRMFEGFVEWEMLNWTICFDSIGLYNIGKFRFIASSYSVRRAGKFYYNWHYIVFVIILETFSKLVYYMIVYTTPSNEKRSNFHNAIQIRNYHINMKLRKMWQF